MVPSRSEYGVKIVTASSREYDEGLVVAFALRAFPVVVGARDGVMERRERGEEQGPFQDLVSATGSVFAPDGGAGASRDGHEARVRREVAG